MKKSRAETAETRERIIQAAAAEFRRNGIHATGLAEIMAAAGLTQGGFYRHFASKDQLVAEACAEAMSSAVSVAETMRGGCTGKDGLQAIVDNFLSMDHRDNQLEGCPLVGLGIELARADDGTREAASEGFVELVDVIAKQFPRSRSEAAKARAIFALSAMIGAVTMARIVTDPALSAAILQEAKTRLSKL
jgi:TetR/AcrR family transcriptional repressor of nem operon